MRGNGWIGVNLTKRAIYFIRNYSNDIAPIPRFSLALSHKSCNNDDVNFTAKLVATEKLTSIRDIADDEVSSFFTFHSALAQIERKHLNSFQPEPS